MKYLTLKFLKQHWPKILSAIFFVILFSAYVNIFAIFSPGATLDPNCAPGTAGCIVQSASTDLSDTINIARLDTINSFTKTINLRAGSNTAGSAPIKFTSGTLLDTTEAGAVEFDGSHLYLTLSNGGPRYQIDQQGGSGSMVYPSAGIAISTGTGWGTSIANNSSNWNIAYSQTRQWDGGSTGLVAATGRASLGLGTAALNNTGDFVAYRTFGTAANSATTDFAPALTANQNYVTNAQLTVIGNTSGTNTGDETTSSIKTKLGAASTSTDGYLTSSDWNTFNGKQATLVSGTNIKTINSTSLLGSGDIAVQPTLVSGTNIKTINGTTLLGSGDMTISGAGGDVTGPASSVDNNVVFFSGTSGKIIKDSGITLSGSNTGDNAVNSLYSATVASGAQNLFWATPNGSSGVPSLRAIVAADIPTLNQNTTGTAAGLSSILASTSGGSGVNNAGTLTWGAGGTLGTAAYTASTAY